jgi:hypothetical protein
VSFFERSLFHFFIALELGSNPSRLKFWRSSLFAMFLLGIFRGVLLCVVGIRLFLYFHLHIIDLGQLTNCYIIREGPLIFLLKGWSHLLEGMDFYTTSFLESLCKTFSDMKNPAREKPMHKNIMSKFLEDTNQGAPSQGDYFSFPFFGNNGSPFMATLNIPGLNVGLSVWL